MQNYIYNVDGKLWEIQRPVGRILGGNPVRHSSFVRWGNGVTGTKILTPLELKENIHLLQNTECPSLPV